MKPRLVFIDDDPHELHDMRGIIQARYEYCPIPWPLDRSLEELIGEPPAVFILDLFFPSEERGAQRGMPQGDLEAQAAKAAAISRHVSALYDRHLDSKELLRETFSCIGETYDLLWEQCRVLQQSPSEGLNLLSRLRVHPKYKRVPVVFYSRKVTVEQAMHCLEAGAVAVIPKPKSPPDRESSEKVLAQIMVAEGIPRGWKARLASILNLNVNVTLLSLEQNQNKQTNELVGMKLGG